MKPRILITGIISSLILGFLFAGFLGALCFALILTVTIYLLKKKSQKTFTKMGVAGSFFSLFIFGYFLMYFGGLIGADQEIRKKLDLIKYDIKSKGYKASWIVISQKRVTILNNFFKNSAKRSWHLQGKAIDIYVFDINGDNTFNKEDIRILDQAKKSVEKKHPDLIGGFGDYFLEKHDYLTKHMIHIDTRGYSERYTK